MCRRECGPSGSAAVAKGIVGAGMSGIIGERQACSQFGTHRATYQRGKAKNKPINTAFESFAASDSRQVQRRCARQALKANRRSPIRTWTRSSRPPNISPNFPLRFQTWLPREFVVHRSSPGTTTNIAIAALRSWRLQMFITGTRKNVRTLAKSPSMLRMQLTLNASYADDRSRSNFHQPRTSTDHSTRKPPEISTH